MTHFSILKSGMPYRKAADTIGLLKYGDAMTGARELLRSARPADLTR